MPFSGDQPGPETWTSGDERALRGAGSSNVTTASMRAGGVNVMPPANAGSSPLGLRTKDNPNLFVNDPRESLIIWTANHLGSIAAEHAMPANVDVTSVTSDTDYFRAIVRSITERRPHLNTTQIAELKRVIAGINKAFNEIQ